MNKISVIGFDLAKTVFQAHAINEKGEVALRKKLTRAQMRTFFAKLPPCLIGMVACGGATTGPGGRRSLGIRLAGVLSAFTFPARAGLGVCLHDEIAISNQNR